MEEEPGNACTVIREGILSVREFHFSLEDWRISREAMLCEKAKGRGHFTKDDVMAMKEKLAEEKKNFDVDDEVKSSDKKQKKIAKKLEDERKQLIKYQIETTKRYINMVETKYKEEQRRLRVEWAKILKENKQQGKEEQKRQRKMRKGKGQQNKENNKGDTNVQAEKNAETEKSHDKTDTACMMINQLGTAAFIEKTEMCTVIGDKGDLNTADGCKNDQKDLKSGGITGACETTGCGDESGIFNSTSNVNYIPDGSNHGNNESPDVVKLDSNYGNTDKSVNESNCLTEEKMNGDGARISPVVPSVDVEQGLSTTDIDIDVECSIVQEPGSKTEVNGAVHSEEDRAVSGINMALADTYTSGDELQASEGITDTDIEEFQDSKDDIQNLKGKDKKQKKKSKGCLRGLFSRLFCRNKSANDKE